MIKSALPVLNKSIVIIFNTILTTGQFPHGQTESLFLCINKVVNLTLITIVVLH